MRKGIQLLIFLLCTESVSAQSSFIDSLQNIVALQKHDSIELSALLNLTNEFSRKDFKKAKYFAHQAVSLSKVTKSNLSLCNGYLYLVVLHQNSGEIDSARHYLQLMENLKVANPHNSKISINYNQTAGFFLIKSNLKVGGNL